MFRSTTEWQAGSLPQRDIGLHVCARVQTNSRTASRSCLAQRYIMYQSAVIEDTHPSSIPVWQAQQ